MGSTSWWSWLFPLFIASPWFAAIAWVLLRTRSSDGDMPPSLGEQLRRRLR
jgi:hypothetical protein